MLAPICIFVYNRLDHAKNLIDSLSRCNLADKSDVYIFSDFYKSASAKGAVLAVREYLEKLKNNHNFKSLEIRYNVVNIGLAKSVISGVTKVINTSDKVIVIEDDLVVSPIFLDYMNYYLDKFKINKKVWSISGYTPSLKYLKKIDESVYVTPRSSSWGWATWSDRWNLVDWDLVDYDGFKNNKKRRKNFNESGNDLSRMLDNYVLNKNSSWAIRFCYAQFIYKKLSIYPKYNLVLNNGHDGSGTHNSVNKKFSNEFIENFEYKENKLPKLNKKLLKEFKNYYLSDFRYFLSKIKNRIKK